MSQNVYARHNILILRPEGTTSHFYLSFCFSALLRNSVVCSLTEVAKGRRLRSLIKLHFFRHVEKAQICSSSWSLNKFDRQFCFVLAFSPPSPPASIPNWVRKFVVALWQMYIYILYLLRDLITISWRETVGSLIYSLCRGYVCRRAPGIGPATTTSDHSIAHSIASGRLRNPLYTRWCRWCDAWRPNIEHASR